ncbi:MAG: NAD(P)H-binding protein [Gaiellaceae bacterium]
MILLTGATGNVGSALLPRLTEQGERVRCLVRDPRRLGSERVRVQITFGDLSDPASFRNALRGVDTVVHLAAAIRDQQRASIEELNGVATLRLIRAAKRAGVERFVFFSAMGASLDSRSRFFRAKALAEQAVEESGLDHLIFLPSIVYSPGDPWTKLLHTMSYLPAMPISGSGRASYQPISADDVSAAVVAALDGKAQKERIELAGPEELTYNDITREALRAYGRRRRLLHVPLPIVKAGLEAIGRFAGEGAFATWEEAELMEISMTTARGTEDVEALGVKPRRMADVLAS